MEGGARVPLSEACMCSICPPYPDEYLCDGEVAERGGKVEGGA
jgi:hypothetical protein